MSFRLSSAARSEGCRLHSHDRLDSTNTEAMRLARDGALGPLWVAARRQEAGRGRRGNVWQSPEGNLFASLLWPVAGVAPEMVATLGFVAGVALIDAIRDVCRSSDPQPHPEVPASASLEGEAQRTRDPLEPSFEASLRSAPQDEGRRVDSPFRLKWPNDVLMDGRKLAGILLEAEQLPGGRRAVVIGFGVNVAASPENLPYPAAALRPAHAVDAPSLLESLTERFVEAAQIWNKGRGFPKIRQLWLERAAGVGAPVSVRTAETTLSGVFDTIDEGGRLVILAPDGTRRTVTAGEVHFGSAATAA
jgi:BirA family biotin operon repressor/biotin-[acetyl-CoA-carboxylase] ligase